MQKWFELLSRTVGNMLLARDSTFDRRTRMDLCNILDEMGALAKPSTYLLLEAFRKDPDADVRVRIARSLGNIGGPESLHDLMEAALRDGEDFFVRRESVLAIAKVAVAARIEGIELSSVVETLLLIIEGQEVDLGDAAADVLPDLLRLSNDEKIGQRVAVRIARVLNEVPRNWMYNNFVASLCRCLGEIGISDPYILKVLEEIADPAGPWADPADIEAQKALAKLGANDQQLV